MTSRDFIVWLQGYLELSEAKTLTEKQLTIVKQHMALVFKHEASDLSHEDIESMFKKIKPGPLGRTIPGGKTLIC